MKQEKRGKVIEQTSGENWVMYLGDCVEVSKGLPESSVDYSVFSPPFSTLYLYSDSIADMGNCRDDTEFFEHFGYLIPELWRVTVPGRLCSVHCKDLPLYMNRDGAAGLRDFPGAIVREFEKHGWVYHSRVTIWKDPVIEMQRTKNHGLLYKNFQVRGEVCRQGMADFIITFRKWDDSAEKEKEKPVIHNPNEFSLDVWQRWASPVWMDIDQTDVLNYQIAKDEKDEKHICVARDSLVLTESGYRPIQNIEVGDLVLTHLGKWKPVTAKRLIGQRDVIRITAQGVPNLVVTPEHKLWTRIGKGDYARQKAFKGNPAWIDAKNTLGSYLHLPLPPIEDSELTENEWWIVGRWLGNGHMSVRNLPFITCAFDEVDELLQRLGWRAGHVGKTQTASQIYIKGRDGHYGDHLHRMIEKCGKGAANKLLPREALALEPAKAAALLNGYLSADGHYVEEYQRYTSSSVSRALLLGMAMIAQRVYGVVASVYGGRKARQHIIEGRTVNAKDEWILSVPPKNLSAFILDDGAWKKVRTLEEVGEAEVWDIQVEDDESFIVEGCAVHNCPLQLGVIKRCVELWTNKGDVILSPFAGVGSEGYESLLAGRKFIGIELKKSYFELAIKYLKQAELEEVNSHYDLFSQAGVAVE